MIWISHPAIALELATRVFHSRGEEHFRMGRIAESVADFERQAQLQPDRAAEHWQLGIAYYYADEYEKGAATVQNFTRQSIRKTSRMLPGIFSVLHAPKGSAEAARETLHAGHARLTHPDGADP